MIELKITTNTAEELTSDIKNLYNRIVGGPVVENIEATGRKVEVSPTEETKKVTKKSVSKTKAEPKEEAPAPAPELVEAATLEDVKTYTVDEVRAAAKTFAQADPANKTKLAAFLHEELEVESISDAPTEVYPRIMKFVEAN